MSDTVLTCADGSLCAWPRYCDAGGRCAVVEKATIATALSRRKQDSNAREAELIARWRHTHPGSFCSDRVAILLARMEGEFGREAS